MAEAIFPFVVYPSEGQLPFINTARVMRGSELLAMHVPISVWPVIGGQNDVGAVYDHQGESPLEHGQLLKTPNVRLYIDDTRYTIVDISRHEYIPHVALALREVNPTI